MRMKSGEISIHFGFLRDVVHLFTESDLEKFFQLTERFLARTHTEQDEKDLKELSDKFTRGAHETRS